MPISFPTSPTNGQTYTYQNKTWTYSTSTSTWDANTTASIATAVAPITYDAATQSVGLASSPALTGYPNASGGYIVQNTNQYKTMEFFQSTTRRAVIYAEETGQQLVLQNEGSGSVSIVNGGATRMVIDNGGRVTMPAQPRFFAWRAAGDIAVANVVLYDQYPINVGSCYNASTGRFTAPIAGTYSFTVEGIFGTTLGTYRLYYRLNGAVYQGDYHLRVHNYTGGEYTKGARSLTIMLAAGDYIEMYFGQGPGNMYGQSQYATFSGYLLG